MKRERTSTSPGSSLLAKLEHQLENAKKDESAAPNDMWLMEMRFNLEDAIKLVRKLDEVKIELRICAGETVPRDEFPPDWQRQKPDISDSSFLVPRVAQLEKSEKCKQHAAAVLQAIHEDGL